MSPSGAYTFLPWLRTGIANKVTAEDFAAVDAERATVDVGVRVTGKRVAGGPDATQDVTRPVALYGPGDVVGIDTRAIVRTEPRNWITNFEPNYLAFVEFYDEDFPWRYTPTAPHGARKRLRPWLSLVVLEEGEFEDAGTLPGKPLPVIAAGDFAKLPPADELWAWAHVHVDRGLGGAVATDDVTGVLAQLAPALASDPDVALSRLVCPRRLEENRAYHAFVVPTFETGRLAGLGGDPADSPSATTSAWAAYNGRPDADRLPVYHRWFFRTGTAGDFEQLVRLLQPRPLDPRVGTRNMDVLRPGSGLPPIADPALKGVLRLGGALRVPEVSLSTAERAQAKRYEDWDTPYPHAFQTALAAFVDLADDLATGEQADPDPLIAPPLYGRWHSLTSRLLTERDGSPAAPDDNWVHELNLDPRFRVSAGFGTKVVQTRQEEYMAAAWEQVGEILEANRRVRLGQLGREVSGRLHARHLEGNLSLAGTVLSLTAPAQARALVGGVTAKHATATSLLGATAVSAPMRRVIRPRSRLVRGVGLGGGEVAALLPKLAAGEVAAAPPKVSPPGVGTVADIAETVLPKAERRRRRWLAIFARRWLPILVAVLLVLAVVLFAIGAWLLGVIVLVVLILLLLAFLWRGGAGALWKPHDPVSVTVEVVDETVTPEAVAALPTVPGFELTQPRPDTPPLTPGASDSATGKRYKEALDDAARTLVGSRKTAERPPRRPLDLDGLAEGLVHVLDPDRTIPRRVLAGIHVPARLEELIVERFVEAMAYPVIDVPMYKPLSDISTELFVPNLNLIEQNSITLLETNQRFIEAYMTGLNHEMARELLWREYPTDQRGSPFRQFWDVTAYLGPADEDQDERRERLRDIPPLHHWARHSALGDHDHREEGGASEEEVVLAIRGELLKKYPTCVVYANRAEWVRDDQGHIDQDAERRLVRLSPAQEADPPRSIVRTPLYEAKVDPDITFFGFDLTAAAARGGSGEDDDDDAGWFFVLRERPGEPRFGLDLERDGALNVWNDLAWPDVAPASAAFIPVGAQVTSPPLVEPTAPDVVEKRVQWEDDRFVAWNAQMTSADVAYVLYQSPVLVAVHAREMLR
ncbi:MAG TPA: hypothetical protein VF587_06710 [Solirubrobacteraceae bacterium]